MKQLEKQILPAIPQLKKYMSLILKWQKAINLVSKSEENDLWQRHILDSAQLFFLIPDTASSLVDMGTGGGFPGLVLAVLNQELKGRLTRITLIESDARKCVFLQEVARELGVNVTILNERLENVKGVQSDVVTSRALGCVSDLLRWGKRFQKERTVFLFLKGVRVDQELEQNPFLCQVEKIPSVVNSTGCVLKMTEVC